MSDRPHILILTASAGGGHLIAAGALEHAFRTLAPEAEVSVLDVLTISRRAFRRAYAGGYLDVVQRFPALMGWIYDQLDYPPNRLYETLRRLIQDCNRQPTWRYLQAHRPSLIVNTHYLPAEFVAQLRRRGGFNCPQVTVTTDYETHRMWVHEPTERYYTATEDGRAFLTVCGVPPDRIRVTGIPVRPGFQTELSRAEAQQRRRLDQASPVVLLSCGGFGVGPTEALLRELIAMPAAAQIVVAAGRNEKLRRRLEGLAAVARRPVHILGFTDVMHEWMWAADVLVSKPGGLTVAEALACGLPLVIMNPIPGQETRNSDYVLESGAGLKVNHIRMLGPRVSALLADPERLHELRGRAQALGRPNAARDIAADALRLLP